MGECSDYITAIQADSKVKFAAWSIRIGGHLALTDFHSEDLSELSHIIALRHRWYSSWYDDDYDDYDYDYNYPVNSVDDVYMHNEYLSNKNTFII